MLKQPKMGCHLIFYQGLLLTRWQSTCMNNHYHVGPNNISKPHTPSMQGVLLGWHCLFWEAVACVGHMQVAKSRSQYLSHMMPALGEKNFPLGQGEGFAQFDHMDPGNTQCTCCLLHEKGEVFPTSLCGPSNIEGDGFHLIMLKKYPFLLEQIISYPHNILWQSFQLPKISGMTEMVMKQEKNKRFIQLPPHMKAMFIC